MKLVSKNVERVHKPVVRPVTVGIGGFRADAWRTTLKLERKGGESINEAVEGSVSVEIATEECGAAEGRVKSHVNDARVGAAIGSWGS